MNSGDILRLIMVAAGIYLIYAVVNSLAKQKMTEIFCIAWGIFAVLLVLGGVLLRPVGLSGYISNTGLVIGVLIGTLVILAAYFLSYHISELIRKNREMSMQIAIMKKQIEEIQKKDSK